MPPGGFPPPPPGPGYPGAPPFGGPPIPGFAPIPQGYPPGYSPNTGGPGANWRPGDAVGFAWERIKADPLVIIGALAVGAIIAGAPSIVGEIVAEMYWAVIHGTSGTTSDWAKFGDPAYALVRLASMAIGYVAQGFMLGGMTHFCLKVARGESYAFADIFGGARWFLPAVGTSILMTFGIMFGFVLLIVPGIFLGLAWSLALPAVVDRNLGPVEALSESFRLTEGHRASIFVLWLMFAGITILGFCACGIGAVVAAAIGQVAIAWVYVQVSGRNASS